MQSGTPITRMSPDLLKALASAPQTQFVEVGTGALGRTAPIFDRYFHDRTPVIVADGTTFEVAGRQILNQLRQGGHPQADSFLFVDREFYAAEIFVERLQQRLAQEPSAVPVAVGSGTINDITKLAAQRTGRRYLAVATAASMDGYTAFGASITDRGSKQTVPCAAPQAVIVDIGIIAAAPSELNAAGYADLLAKVTAGADWLLADALEVEPLHPTAWQLAQGNLRRALQDPAGVRTGDTLALENLMEGLISSGLAMQFASSSRPASGAEHQFSHLWDMEHHTFHGRTPLHGCKVGIGTLAISALYEFLLAQPLDQLDVERCCGQWSNSAPAEADLRAWFPDPALAGVAARESEAKHIDVAGLRGQLTLVQQRWPGLRERLGRQLLGFADLERALGQAGAPTRPEQIGLTWQRMRQSFRAAYCIRCRFTVLDLVVRAGLLEKALGHIFGAAGHWPIQEFDQSARPET